MQRYTAIPGTVRIDILHSVVSVSVLAAEAVSSSVTALRENAPGEARTLAGSVLRHIPIARDRASRAGTFPVEKDHEDQATEQGESTEDTDDDTGN